MKSIYYCCFVIILSILFSVNLQAQSDSYIQIHSKPFVKVFLDDEYQGTTSEKFDGLIIKNINSGTYKISLKKEGYVTQEEMIKIDKGEVFLYKVKPFKPKYKISQSGSEEEQEIKIETGNLVIQSIPVKIQIECDELMLKENKTKDVWKIEALEVGKYRFSFLWKDKTLSKKLHINTDSTHHYFIDFFDETIQYKGAERIKKSNVVIANDNENTQAKRNTPIVSKTFNYSTSETISKQSSLFSEFFSEEVRKELFIRNNTRWNDSIAKSGDEIEITFGKDFNYEVYIEKGAFVNLVYIIHYKGNPNVKITYPNFEQDTSFAYYGMKWTSSTIINGIRKSRYNIKTKINATGKIRIPSAYINIDGQILESDEVVLKIIEK